MFVRSLRRSRPGGSASETAPLPRRAGLPRFSERWRSNRDDAFWGAGFVASGPDLLLVCDERLRLVYHNRAFSRALGDARGSFKGLPLCDFFPSTDRAELRSWLRDFLEGRLGNLGFSVSLLTLGDPVPVEARVARQTRRGKRRHLYLSLREAAAPAARPQAGESGAAPGAAGRTGILDGLPAALFRTDPQLNIVHASGSLWETFQTEPATLVGSSLVDASCHLVPPFLHEVDYCDTMAGLTLQTDLTWRGEAFVLTVEPFIDQEMKVVGTLGMLRKARQVPASAGSTHLDYPRPEDYTQAIKLPRAVVISPSRRGSAPIPAPVEEREASPDSTSPKARPTSPLPPPEVAAIAADDDEIASLRRRIRPRPLTSEDFCKTSSRSRGCASKEETGRTRTVSLPS